PILASVGIYRYLFIFLLCSFPIIVQSQPHYFRSYGVKEGLSGNAVVSILQDSRGFMWFGTRCSKCVIISI
ncbi:MAG: hypothetical protein EOO43_22890, partial [Flavobacterium sp.]